MKLPTEKQLKYYLKLRKKGFSVKVSEDLMKHPSLAKKVLAIKHKWKGVNKDEWNYGRTTWNEHAWKARD